MNQPVPKVSAADVERVVKRDFSPEEVAAVLKALEAYGSKTWHNEVPRVRLAILKIANGDRDRLREALAMADVDYRDALCNAEYLNYARRIAPGEKASPAKSKEAVEADWQDYRTWFEKK